MSAFAQCTEVDHCGGVAEEVTFSHFGSPERLGRADVSMFG